MSKKPTAGQFIVVSRWLEAHKQEILDTRPNQKDLVQRIREETTIPIGVQGMMQICKQLGINWITKKSRSSSLQATQAAIRILSDAVFKLYTDLGIKVPQELVILVNTLEEKEKEE